LFKDPLHERTNLAFILDDQNGLAAARRQRGAHFRGLLRDTHNARQVDREDAARSQRALDPDISAALTDDAVDRRQTESRPLAQRLRREEGLEDAGTSLRVHADARVPDRERHVRAGTDTDVPAGRDRKSTRLNSSHVAISYAV